ncbi:MAG: N-acetylglucosamine-6-phosphate deacetylase [Paracoccus denitrificans]|nr:MAG: N-acetylglucosamine-6-phosphate deacetylase [Paracoccus denitrificans]PZO84865.1 MAG: N-acetylglucosamine-6-phosphate deacetylase [Paracoccus denitrificans]
MTTLIAADQVWVDGRLQDGLAVVIDGDRVVDVRALGDDTPDATVPILMPGCTDLQVNGGGGVLLNTDPTPNGIRAIVAAHHRLGTVSILPTLITDAPDVMDAAADAIIATHGEPSVAGIHLEGPHLAVQKRGTHEARFIRPLDDRTMGVLARLRQADVPVLLTLAVELADPALLRQAAQMGVVLSAGHSMATEAEARAAMSNGVTMFTHLYNAMPQMQSREPGMIAAAILSDAYCGLITDGIHVSPDMLALTMAARPRPDRCFIVSDAMPTVGGPDHFTLYGREIRVKDGALVNAEGSLAGAHIDMVGSIRSLVALTGVGVGQAIAMATDIPRAAMSLPPIRVAPGTPVRDLIALDAGLHLIPLPV